MALTVKNLHKRFGSKIVFEDFSYSFSDKGIYALVGDSGIGKTTLLRIISGLDKKYDGEVLGGGYKNTSFAFQEYRLFPQLNAYENVAYSAFYKPNNEDFKAAKSILISLGFSEEECNLLPSELSGGMKQRVSLSRAFLKKSNILILDEPTKELDKQLSDKILEIMIKESGERLVIFVSHTNSDVEKTNANIIKLSSRGDL